MFYDLSNPGIGDYITVTNGNVMLDGRAFQFNFMSYTPQTGDRWKLMEGTSISDNLAGIVSSGFITSNSMLLLEHRLGKDVLILYIPEPATATLLAAGAVLLLRRRSTRR